jgi:hypothetical protein
MQSWVRGSAWRFMTRKGVRDSRALRRRLARSVRAQIQVIVARFFNALPGRGRHQKWVAKREVNTVERQWLGRCVGSDVGDGDEQWRCDSGSDEWKDTIYT